MPSTPAPDRFTRLTDLFRQACAATPASRTALLDETRGEDPELAEELEALLAADETLGDEAFLDPLPGVGDAVRRAAEEVSDDDPAHASPAIPRTALRDRTGQQIGDFTIERLLAQGGMGAVYLARQSHPARQVAIKLLRDELPSPRQRERFQLEVDVLARLQHPGIAAIHAAGTSERHPWLAMEYVPGARPITVHAEAESLDTRTRVRMLRQIADAVRHAHQRGVIHRDLKPANLIVGDDGRVRVIDFGVARADELVTRAARQTAAGELLGTLAYMSPEQCAGMPDAVDVRSDVYALGIVLHELVVGRRPHELEGLSLAEAVTQISRQGVPRLRSTMPGVDVDLQCIVQVATALDPVDRYQSTDAFIADLDRWLAGEPIAARPPGPIRQIRLFVRRRKALSALIGSAMAAAAAIALVILSFGVRLAEEGQATRVALVRSERMLDFLVGVLGSGSDRNTDAPTQDLEEVLTVASRRLDFEFADDPDAEYRLREALGLSWQTMGEYDRALAEFDRQLAIAEAMPDASPSMFALPRGHRARLFFDVDERELAEREYRAATELYRQDPDAEPSAVLAAEQSVAMIEANRGDADALVRLEGLFDTSQRTTGNDSYRTMRLKESLATALVDDGRAVEAETLLREVVQESDRTFVGAHPRRIAARNHLGWALVNQGRFADAIAVLDEAIAMSTDLFGPAHPRTTWIRGTRLDALVRTLAPGETEDARQMEAEARDLLAARLETLGPRSISVALAEALVWRILSEQGRFDESLPFAESSHARTLDIFGPDHPSAGRSAQLVGLTLSRLGRPAEAIAMLEEARDIVVRASGDTSRETALAQNELAIAYAGAGRWEAALATFRLALAIYEAGDSPLDPERIKTQGNIGRCLVELGRHAEAIPILEAACAAAAEVYGPAGTPRVLVETSYGEALVATGATDDGVRRLRSLRPLLQAIYGPDHPRLARIDRVLAADADGRADGDR